MLRASGSGWTVLTHDAMVTSHPAYLSCIIVTVVTAGDYIEIYDGPDASSGRKILTLKALANRSIPFNFSQKLPCENGLYITFSATDSEATVVWEPMEQVVSELDTK